MASNQAPLATENISKYPSQAQFRPHYHIERNPAALSLSVHRMLDNESNQSHFVGRMSRQNGWFGATVRVLSKDKSEWNEGNSKNVDQNDPPKTKIDELTRRCWPQQH
jgi:hypothetical protein